MLDSDILDVGRVLIHEKVLCQEIHNISPC